MNRNKRFVLGCMLALVALVALFGFGFQRNQVARAQDGMIVCDLTLITLLYIAEHDYGHFPMTDVSNIDKGQYTPLFDAMMAMMEQMEPTEEAMMEATEEAMMEATEDPAMAELTQLQSGVVAGENETCTALRAELDAWFLEHFKHEMMTSEG